MKHFQNWIKLITVLNLEISFLTDVINSIEPLNFFLLTTRTNTYF